MNEEELKAKADELQGREESIARKEEELKEREDRLSARETDAGNLAQTIKEEYEKRLESQKQEFEERLKQRDDVIRQLASGKQVIDDGPFAELNKKRRAQKAS